MAVLVRAATSLHTTNTNNNASTLQNSLSLSSVPSNPLLLTSRNRNFSPPLRLRRRFPLPSPPHPGRCLAAKPGHPPPPPPPESDPNPDPPRNTGSEGSLSKFQDRMQIFFAVLFWMSLFFWTCAWDDRNRPNKGSRFRR